MSEYPTIKLIKKEKQPTRTETFEIEEEKLKSTGDSLGEVVAFGDVTLARRNEGNLAGKALYLGNIENWKIVLDDFGYACLICWGKEA